jgi:hypothetical protein
MRYCHRARDGRVETKISHRPYRVTKFGTDVHPNTLSKFTGNGVSSYFRSAAIRHFVNADILDFGQFFSNGLIKIHQIW